MKKLLLYDPSADVRNPVSVNPEWQLQKVCSVSETLKHQFLNWGAPEPDAFAVRASVPAPELATLVLYIRKHRPLLPVILILENARAIEMWKGLLKGVEVVHYENETISAALNPYIFESKLHMIK